MLSFGQVQNTGRLASRRLERAGPRLQVAQCDDSEAEEPFSRSVGCSRLNPDSISTPGIHDSAQLYPTQGRLKPDSTARASIASLPFAPTTNEVAKGSYD